VVQPWGKLRQQPARQNQTICAAIQRQGWLKIERVHFYKFSAWDIRQVSADKIESFISGWQQVCLLEIDLSRDLMRLSVLSGNIQCRR